MADHINSAAAELRSDVYNKNMCPLDVCRCNNTMTTPLTHKQVAFKEFPAPAYKTEQVCIPANILTFSYCHQQICLTGKKEENVPLKRRTCATLMNTWLSHQRGGRQNQEHKEPSVQSNR